MLDYLRVCDGGVKDKHALLKVCNYECDAEVGGDTRQEGHYRGLREFRSEKEEGVVRCSHEYIVLRRWLLARGNVELLVGFDTALEAAHHAGQYPNLPVGNPQPDDYPGGYLWYESLDESYRG